MPYKDRERRLHAMENWRKKRTPEYHKWLYERRYLRFWKAETFEKALEQVAEVLAEDPSKTGQRALTIARAWLDEAAAREKELGNRFDHEKNQSYNEEE